MLSTHSSYIQGKLGTVQQLIWRNLRPKGNFKVSCSHDFSKATYYFFIICQLIYILISSVHFSSVAQSCPTLCDPMNRSTPGLPVHHQLPQFTETHVHRVSDAIQPSHPLSSPSPPALKYFPASESFPMSQLFAWGGQTTGVSALASFLPKNTQG